MQLSLEDNVIGTFSGKAKQLGLSGLPNMMELYISNNKIENLKEIIMLMNQPKLIILDVSNNIFCKDPSYRIFTLYHLKKLKVKNAKKSNF